MYRYVYNKINSNVKQYYQIINQMFKNEKKIGRLV